MLKRVSTILTAAALTVFLQPLCHAQVSPAGSPVPDTRAQGTPSVEVTGLNATTIVHSRGQYEKIGPNLWLNTLEGGPHGTLTEIQRDEWSVYLRRTDGTEVQIDLYRKEVSQNTVEGRSVIMTVTDAIAGQHVPTPADVVTIVSDAGLFYTYDKVSWSNRFYENDLPVTYELQEVGRDQWSVYLRDDVRQVEFALDMYTNTVKQRPYNDPQNAFADAGRISGASDQFATF
ncbi:MAG: hypothetical protein AAF456_06745 [Planctomycetota bacterium]